MAIPCTKLMAIEIPVVPFSLSEYLTLVDATDRQLREDKRGALPDSRTPILERVGLNPRCLITMVKELETQFSHAILSLKAR